MFQRWKMNFVKCKSKKNCWKSRNVLPKVKIKVEGSFFPGKFSSNPFSRTRTTKFREDCRNVFVRCVKIFWPKCTKIEKITVFSKDFSRIFLTRNTKFFHPNTQKNRKVRFYGKQKHPKTFSGYLECSFKCTVSTISSEVRNPSVQNSEKKY